MPALRPPLTPFVDPLALPPRWLAREHDGHLAVRIRCGVHRFHRDLPDSRIWGFDGCIPGPTIEAERGHPVRVEWINELEGTLPVAVTVAPTESTAAGVPVQCVPGLSGGVRDADAAALPGYTVVHLHGGSRERGLSSSRAGAIPGQLGNGAGEGARRHAPTLLRVHPVAERP